MDNDTPKNRPSIMEVLSKDPKEKKNVDRPSEFVNGNSNQKEIIKERVVVEYRDKPQGCMPDVGCGCGCRTITCGGCLFFLLIIIGFIYIVINKPPVIWSEVVSFLNAEQSAPAYKPQDLDSLQDSINNQINEVGEVTIELTQDQLTTLIRDKSSQLNELTIDIEKDKLYLYFYLDKTLPAKPLYGIVEISEDNNNLAITRIGTGKVALPEIFNKTATNTIYSLLNIDTTNEQNPTSILSGIFNSESLDIKKVEFIDDAVKITADIKVNVFQQ